MKSNIIVNRSDHLFKCLCYFFLALILTVVVYVRIRLLTVPLERDEGEFAYMGQLLLKGIPPFAHCYTMKIPGVSVVYAIFMFLFGQTATGIHVGLMIVNGTCIYLLYLLTKKLYESNTAILSCASYAVLSLSSSVSGYFAHATHFVVLFTLAGFVLLLYPVDNRRFSQLFFSGLCFGLAVTMKQHAALLLIFAILYFGWATWKKPFSDKKAGMMGSCLFLIGMIIPYVLIVFLIVMTGNFTNFWFWTVQYANEYTSSQTLASGWENFKYSFGDIIKIQSPLWLLAGLGCVLSFLRKGHSTDNHFVFGFLLFSFLALCPGLFFRDHYFVLLFPIVAIMIGAGVHTLMLLLSSLESVKSVKFVPFFLLVVAISYSLYNERNIFFSLTPLGVSRATNGANPFPEALQIAKYIKNNTSPSEQIVVLGSEPEIYFYADRLSATGFIYMYGLMENQPYAEDMQLQMIREIEVSCPKYVVVVSVGTSWLATSYSKLNVFNWATNYLKNQYVLVGVIDIIDFNTTRYLWGAQVVGYSPASKQFLEVFERKKSA